MKDSQSCCCSCSCVVAAVDANGGNVNGTPSEALAGAAESASAPVDAAGNAQAASGDLDEAAALDRELEGARRERERVEMELAADSFLTSLTHAEDPKAAERAAQPPSDLASDCSVDDTAFASLAAGGLQRGKSFDAIGATVTDDEFNALVRAAHSRALAH